MSIKYPLGSILADSHWVLFVGRVCVPVGCYFRVACKIPFQNSVLWVLLGFAFGSRPRWGPSWRDMGKL
jgi:hypothetical protein